MAKDVANGDSTGIMSDDIGHRKRLKERFMKSPALQADYELLELLLTFSIPRRDVKPYAKQLINSFGSLTRVLNAEYEDLLEFKGVSFNTGVLFSLVKELSSRCLYEQLKERDVIMSPDAVADFVRSRVGFSKNEKFLILFLDSKNHLLECDIVSEGTADKAVVYPRMIVKQVLKYNATGVLAVHNHPSGVCEPSGADLQITGVLREALTALDVRLLDHIIVSSSGYFSFKEEGLL